MDLTPVLVAYPSICSPSQIDSLGCAGGFSGAAFWRLHTPQGPLCLRRWPREHPTVQQLQFIHAVLRHVTQSGFALVPVPLATRNLASYVRHEGYLWELTPWMPGEADFHRQPSVGRLRAALEVLARFHRAAEDFPLSQPRSGPSPGIHSRSGQLGRWLAGDLERLQQSIQPGIWPELDDRARRICHLVPRVAPAVVETLARVSRLAFVTQTCLGDIWHDHVLFQGDQVTGLVDFGAMRADNVATDVARLLGSMAGDDPTFWSAGLEAYQVVRLLSEPERLLVQAFDQSTVLMAGLNWIEWIYQERRVFEAGEVIVSRLDSLIARLEHLQHRVADVSWQG